MKKYNQNQFNILLFTKVCLLKYKTRSMGHPVRVELTFYSCLASIENHDTTVRYIVNLDLNYSYV